MPNEKTGQAPTVINKESQIIDLNYSLQRVVDALSFIEISKIDGKDARKAAELIGWLEHFKMSLERQIDTLKEKDTVPDQATPEPEPVAVN